MLMLLMSISCFLVFAETVVAAVEKGASVGSPGSRAGWCGGGGGGEQVSWGEGHAEGGGSSAGDCQVVLVPKRETRGAAK